MASCDEGYLCEVCGKAVERLDESALYLQYVIGWIDPETLHVRRESHLRCQPTLAQFIEDDAFAPVRVQGEFDRQQMDSQFVLERVSLVSTGFRRLRELQRQRTRLNVRDYPLPEAIEKWQ
jgi:hypothetical protein